MQSDLWANINYRNRLSLYSVTRFWSSRRRRRLWLIISRMQNADSMSIFCGAIDSAMSRTALSHRKIKIPPNVCKIRIFLSRWRSVVMELFNYTISWIVLSFINLTSAFKLNENFHSFTTAFHLNVRGKFLLSGGGGGGIGEGGKGWGVGFLRLSEMGWGCSWPACQPLIPHQQTETWPAAAGHA